MEKGGRGGQRVARVCLSPRVCERERRRGMIAHTPTLFCFPPPDTPAELGRSWPTCSVPLTPAHTDLSTFWPITSCPDPTSAHALPVSSKCSQRRQKAEPAPRAEFRALQMQTHVCFEIRTCLFLHVDLPACIRSSTLSQTVYSFTQLVVSDFTVASRVWRPPYCPPGLLVKQVTHKGRLFWLLPLSWDRSWGSPRPYHPHTGWRSLQTFSFGSAFYYFKVDIWIQVFECREFGLIGHVYVCSVLKRKAAFT